jgi:hypothetical protein
MGLDLNSMSVSLGGASLGAFLVIGFSREKRFDFSFRKRVARGMNAVQTRA